MCQLIVDDTRTIKQIFVHEGVRFTAGEKCGIVAYNELGQCGFVTWFAIYKNEEIVARINGMYVTEIYYFDV